MNSEYASDKGVVAPTTKDAGDGDVPQRGSGPQWGAGVNAEPARKPKELKRVTAGTLISERAGSV